MAQERAVMIEERVADDIWVESQRGAITVPGRVPVHLPSPQEVSA